MSCVFPAETRTMSFYIFQGIIVLMLTLTLKKRRFVLIAISIALLLFAGCMSALFYFGNQAIAKTEQESSVAIAKLDKQIATIKVKKAAEKKAKEEAERKAKEEAEKKAAADAALAAQQKGQVVTPKGCAATGAHSNPASIDVVINKKRCFNPIDYTPTDLTSYSGFVVSAKMVPHMTAMFNAAAAAGVPLSLTSSYRSYSNQVVTYNNWVRVNGGTAAADTVSARPGYSEHQTGLAFDLSAGSCSLECFRGSAQYAWMMANAHSFGFIERYPVGLESVTGYSPEAWHWRYVGPATATAMKSSGIKTLEQLWNVSGGSY